MSPVEEIPDGGANGPSFSFQAIVAPGGRGVTLQVTDTLLPATGAAGEKDTEEEGESRHRCELCLNRSFQPKNMFVNVNI